MTRISVVEVVVVVAAAVLTIGCGGEEQESPMASMSAEEHAKMQAGGTQGAMDSTGAALRQPVHLTADQERTIGVRYTTVQRQTLDRTIRTVGRIEPAEPKIADITLKIDGFVEELFVDYTGESVRRGQPLLTIYSPMLVAAQEELLTAVRMANRPGAGEAWRSAQSMLEAARRRLAYWDITDEQIRRIEETGLVTKTLTLAAPFTGIVLEKDVVEGQRVMEGMRLYRLADLRELWVEGDVFEQDLRFVRVGASARIEVEAYPGEQLTGRVSFVYPTVRDDVFRCSDRSRRVGHSHGSRRRHGDPKRRVHTRRGRHAHSPRGGAGRPSWKPGTGAPGSRRRRDDRRFGELLGRRRVSAREYRRGHGGDAARQPEPSHRAGLGHPGASP